MTVIPAYGRDYTSKAKVQQDWDNGKDFQITGYDANSGRYVNKADAMKGGVKSITVRYAKLRKVCIIKA